MASCHRVKKLKIVIIHAQHQHFKHKGFVYSFNNRGKCVDISPPKSCFHPSITKGLLRLAVIGSGNGNGKLELCEKSLLLVCMQSQLLKYTLQMHFLTHASIPFL